MGYFDIGLKVEGKFATEKVLKSMKFGAANALTQTAKQAQAAVQDTLRGTFTLRGRWFEQQNRFGIKVKPATPSNLTARVTTAATWLSKQQQGGTIHAGERAKVFPYTYNGKKYIAIPTETLRPRGSTKILRPALWPNNLKGTFVIRTKKTGALLLVQRVSKGRGKGLKAMYLLIEQVKVVPERIWDQPIQNLCERKLGQNLQQFINEALANIR